MQFVLETHDNPDQYVIQALAAQDDVFVSTHRLIGRCVANGAKVSLEVRKAVEEKLIEVWSSATHSGRRRIGQILADGYSQPLSIPLFTILKNPFPPDGFELVVRQQAEKVYLEILETHLKRRPLNDRAIHPLMATQAPYASKIALMTFEEARRMDNKPKEANELARFMKWFERYELPKEACIEAARNTRLQMSVRLACALHCFDILGDEALDLVLHYLRLPNDPQVSIGFHDLAYQILKGLDTNRTVWLEFLLDETVPLENRHGIALGLHQLDQESRGQVHEVESLLRKGMSTPGLDVRLRGDLLVLLAIRDDRDSLDEVTNRLGELTDQQRKLWLALITKMRDLKILARGLQGIQVTSMTGEQKALFIRDGHVFDFLVTLSANYSCGCGRFVINFCQMVIYLFV